MPFCRRVILPGTLAVVLAGCATGPSLPPGAAVEVSSGRAPFYKYGPAQTFGADDMLAQGTRLTLLQRSMGFSRVMQSNGVTGYIANEDISPAAPEPKPKPGSVVTNRKLERLFGSSSASSTGPAKRSNVKPTPGDPLFDVNDVPLPMKEEPAPKPELRTPPPEPRPGSTPAPKTEKKSG